MQSGLFFGYVSMVDGIVRRMRAELEGGDRAACVATGGMADIIAGETTVIERVDPDLTLQGLRLIWERNQEVALVFGLITNLHGSHPSTASKSKPICAARTKVT